MEVVHAFGDLLAEAENSGWVVVSRGHMDLLVEATVAPIGDDGQLRLRYHAKQAKDVGVTQGL